VTVSTTGVRPDVGALPSPEAIRARAGGENFAVTSALLGRKTSRHLLAIYDYARLVDELGDAAPGDRSLLLDVLDEDLEAAFTGTPRHPVLQALADTIRECRLPREPFLRLIEANRRDQRQPEYETFAALVDYCDLSANPVGELVLLVFDAATPTTVELSDDVCTALQLIEHWQDVGEDARHGRVYLPAEDRDRFGVTWEDLRSTETSPALRRLLRYEAERAAELLASGGLLVAALHGRARLAVAGYVGGGRAALAVLAASDYDVLGGPVRSGRARRARLTLLTLGGRW
jgi:squalene synthase HpnC